jgi:DHA2 family multidrug resistance protein
MPGAIATGFSAILCGRLLGGKNPKLKPRYVIGFGMALFVLSMWYLGHMTAQSGEPDTRLALIIRGFGLGCLFTPINLAAFSSLKGIEISQGASLINLARQLGGSFGIAYLGTHLTNQTALHSNVLAAHVYPGNPAFETRMMALQQALMARGYDAVSAHQAALSIIARTVDVQASVMSYNDSFLFIGLAVLLISPCIFLLRSNPPRGAAAPMEH